MWKTYSTDFHRIRLERWQCGTRAAEEMLGFGDNPDHVNFGFGLGLRLDGGEKSYPCHCNALRDNVYIRGYVSDFGIGDD